MKKRLILHDVASNNLEFTGITVTADDTVFPADPIVGSCIGCYSCWIKTPGKCAIEDRGQNFAALLSTHDEFIAVSRLVFGGFSPPVKALLDRSIGNILPFFHVIGHETHHPKRGDGKLTLRYIFYGPNMTPRDKEIATEFTAANARNLSAEKYTVEFHQQEI